MESSATQHNITADKPGRRQPSTNAILAVLMVGTFLAPLDASIVNIALPAIATNLQTSVTAVTWVTDAYLLTVATLLLSMGRLGDTWGLRNLYVWGLLIFGAGSLACALSGSLAMLIGARVLQASGAAMLFAAGPAIVAHTFPPANRGEALGIISLAVAAGLTAGPALGGLLVGAFGWPSIFVINIPLSIIAAGIAWRTLSQEESIGESFDMFGAVLVGGTLLSMLGALTEVETYGIGSLEIIGALSASVFLGVTFIWWEGRAATPMVDLRMFRSRGFSAGLASAAFSYMAMFSITFTMPFYLLRARGMQAAAAGLILTAMPFAMASLAPYAGRLSDRIGSRVLSTAGLLVLAAGLSAMSMLQLFSSLWLVAGCLLTAGAGMAIFQTPNTSAVLSAVPRARVGIASALIAEARNVGMALGIALTAALVASHMGASAAALIKGGSLPVSVANELVGGMAIALRVAAVLALFGAALSWFFRGEAHQQVEHAR
jgi:EmrB/QacA subfamily drug resistance transporter